MTKLNQKALTKNKKVIVGMSGGVDSSVTAAILKSQGYDVVGVFLRFWKEEKEAKKNKLSANDAKEICRLLDIPFKIIDARKKFKDCVVKYFLNEYAAGQTPNPCVFCNGNMKFKVLFDIADKMKADYVATGHYARIVKEKEYLLKQGKDKNKDQSYFLYQLSQDQLARLIFPLGDYTKPEVRKMAKNFQLPVFDKFESQDICFIKDDDTQRFLRENLKMKKGKILDLAGNVIGTHQGLPLYTIGQRRGINIGGTGPYYAASKDFQHNALIVTNNFQKTNLFSTVARIADANWISGEPKKSCEVLVKIRYRQEAAHAIIKKRNKDIFEIEFKKPQRAVTSGQSAVFYAKNGEVIGGGIIV